MRANQKQLPNNHLATHKTEWLECHAFISGKQYFKAGILANKWLTFVNLELKNAVQVQWCSRPQCYGDPWCLPSNLKYFLSLSYFLPFSWKHFLLNKNSSMIQEPDRGWCTNWCHTYLQRLNIYFYKFRVKLIIGLLFFFSFFFLNKFLSLFGSRCFVDLGYEAERLFMTLNVGLLMEFSLHNKNIDPLIHEC